ncbi:alpha-amylase family protein [Marinilongibacter aquaticus]|uniref:alpha-amylase family protein n=1 Tax=Marinilongibacter aquaticus TaxID=2975157 RepID=UPI0021BD2E38|nr:alpha-amylase family protein [Marinilongibacter aquaticus]UBM59240.1 alpha-amylase family protein [Marinilongibacter aquaticus]
MAQKQQDKFVLYQIFTRLFGNSTLTNNFNGTLEQNGVGKFKDINTAALKSIKALGVSHIWYTGIIEHATMTDYSAYGIRKDHPLVVKGIAGSPYAIKDYYDVVPDFAEDVHKRMDEFEALVARTHKQKLKVIIDFVPNHLAREYFSDAKPEGVENFGESDTQSQAFLPSNNFYYIPGSTFKVPHDVNPPVSFGETYIENPAKATGNDVFSAEPSLNDWYETIKLNYGVDYLNHRSAQFYPIPDTWKKMRDILLYWAEKKVDGFRCDMAEMVPAEFWGWVTKEVKKKFPDVIFIAEIYNPNNYRQYIFQGGFDYLYDKVGLYDSLRRLIEGHGNANDISRVWQQESGDFANRMLRFLENHDEHRIASAEFAGDPFKALTAMALSAFLHDGPIMLYAGQELGVLPTQEEGFSGNDGRTTIFDYWGLPELAAWNNGGKWNTAGLSASQKKLRKAYNDILHFALANEAVVSGKFFDLQYVNAHGQSLNYNDSKIYSFLRYTEHQKILFVFNFDLQSSYACELFIPNLAFDMMGIASEKPVLRPMQAHEEAIGLKRDERFDIKIQPNSWKSFLLS